MHQKTEDFLINVSRVHCNSWSSLFKYSSSLFIIITTFRCLSVSSSNGLSSVVIKRERVKMWRQKSKWGRDYVIIMIITRYLGLFEWIGFRKGNIDSILPNDLFACDERNDCLLGSYLENNWSILRGKICRHKQKKMTWSVNMNPVDMFFPRGTKEDYLKSGNDWWLDQKGMRHRVIHSLTQS